MQSFSTSTMYMYVSSVGFYEPHRDSNLKVKFNRVSRPSAVVRNYKFFFQKIRKVGWSSRNLIIRKQFNISYFPILILHRILFLPYCATCCLVDKIVIFGYHKFSIFYVPWTYIIMLFTLQGQTIHDCKFQEGWERVVRCFHLF